jgi:WD40 repeat protein
VAFRFAADGRFSAAHTQPNWVRFWDTRSGSEIGRFQVPILSQMVMSRKGSLVAVMDQWGAVTILDEELKQQIVLVSRPEKLPIRGCTMSFSSDESLLAVSLATVGGGAPSLEVWDVAASTLRCVFPGRRDFRFEFIPGTHSLVFASGTKPRIWRLDPRKEPDAITKHDDETWAAAFSPDGRVLAIGSDDTDEAETIKLWDPSSGRRLSGWKAHTATVASLAFSPDGRRLASASLDSGKPGHGANVLIWDTATHELLATLNGHNAAVRSVAYSPDGRFLVTAGDDLSVRLWDTTTDTTRAILTGHTDKINAVAFSPESRLLASGSNDATVRLWNVTTGQPLAIFHHSGNVNAVAFAPDGALIASADEAGQIKLWNPETAECVLTIHSAADQLRCLAFTRDGRNIVAAGKDKVVRLWDIGTGQDVLSLAGHKAQINALAFSPDGKILASCSHDGAVKLWHAEPIDVVPRH